jgi:hypothetical protein
VEKKTLLTAAFISTLLLIAITEGCFVKLAQANPYRYLYKHVTPPAGAIPLVISVSSPKNNAVYNVNDIALTFNVSDYGTSIDFIYNIYFKASWLQENVIVYKQNSHSPEFPDFWSYDETFWDLPDGESSVVITARGGGYYVDNTKVDYFDGTAYYFEMTTVSVVNFTVATPPEVSVLSPLNGTYDSSDVQLNFTVNESFSKISYVLDHQDNMTIDGNTTLLGLSNGVHNVTVYACENAGNVGSSETITFTVAEPEPLPSASIATASIASVVVAGAVLLVYFKKSKK